MKYLTCLLRMEKSKSICPSQIVLIILSILSDLAICHSTTLGSAMRPLMLCLTLAHHLWSIVRTTFPPSLIRNSTASRRTKKNLQTPLRTCPLWNAKLPSQEEGILLGVILLCIWKKTVDWYGYHDSNEAVLFTSFVLTDPTSSRCTLL